MLGAFAAGWLVAGSPSSPRSETPELSAGRGGCGWARRHPAWSRAAFFGVVGLLADLDLLGEAHSAQTHSVGATCLVLLATALASGGQWVFALAAAAAYGSHPLLDWLGQDGKPPFGVMALWPLTERYYHSGLDWLLAVSRQYWRPDFVGFNLRALTRELLVLVPIAMLAWLARRRRESA
jgi:hypothetical protein